MKDNTKTRMTTFIKTKFKYQKKLDFCGPVGHLRESTILDLESLSNFQVKDKKIIEIGPELIKLCLY